MSFNWRRPRLHWWYSHFSWRLIRWLRGSVNLKSGSSSRLRGVKNSHHSLVQVRRPILGAKFKIFNRGFYAYHWMVVELYVPSWVRRVDPNCFCHFLMRWWQQHPWDRHRYQVAPALEIYYSCLPCHFFSSHVIKNRINYTQTLCSMGCISYHP